METIKSPTSASGSTPGSARGGRGGGTSGKPRGRKKAEGSGTSGSRGGGPAKRGRPSTRGTSKPRGGKGESRSRSRTGTIGPSRDSAVPRSSVGPAAQDEEAMNAPAGDGNEEDAQDADEEEEVEQEEEDEDENEFNIQRDREEQRKASRGILLDAMTQEQIDQHHDYRVTTLNKAKTARFIQHVLSHPPSKPVTTIIQGVGKMFIGEMVGLAREIQRAEMESNGGPSNFAPQPLQPSHILEAYREYRAERERPGTYPADGGAPGLGKKRRLF